MTLLDIIQRNPDIVEELTLYPNNLRIRLYYIYEEFLESRCFLKERDKIKIELKKLNIPFYDPLLIIEKTQGRMAEDKFRTKIER